MLAATPAGLFCAPGCKPKATRAAATVAPAERRERSTISGLHGKPISRMAAAGNCPLVTAWI